MNIMQGYKEVWQSLQNINRAGVKFSVGPSHTRHILSTLTEYDNRADRLQRCYWSHVEFSISSEEDTDAIRREEVRLSSLNIAFDTGGCVGIRDWEIDWSLHIAEDEDIDAMEERRGMVKNALDSMECVQNN
jgi:hypothetical protein